MNEVVKPKESMLERFAQYMREPESTDGRIAPARVPGAGELTQPGTDSVNITPLLSSFDQVPNQLGPWQLLRLLGRGGMGEVWLAERCDGAFEMQVAVKLLRSDRPDVAERFKLERKLLARLDHPNIARLLDGGVTPTGLPYLVTQFVDGEQIERWCERKKTPLKQRLVLFLEVCHAVAYAHSELIVHRDIKPGNILIDEGGNAMLLDFGIAKLVASGSSDETTEESPHTPEYAAPEQVLGGAITTRTDVYALGLLLYVLLTGAHPQSKSSNLADQVERIVERVPPAPSAAVTPEQAQVINPHSLRGDLDTIVMKAIAKAPAERYASVEALIEDLRLHLAHRSILSRPSTRFEQLRSAIRRNLLATGILSVAVSLVLAAASYGIYQSTRAQTQSQVAAQSEREARAARAFVSALLEDLNIQGNAGLQLLEQATQYADSTLAKFPELRVGVTNEIASAYGNLNRYDRRAALFEHLYQRMAGNSLALASSACSLANVRAEAAERAPAEKLLAEAQALLAQEPARSSWAAVDCAISRGRIWHLLGEPERAAAELAHAEPWIRTRTGTDDRLYRELLLAMANAQQQSGRFSEAIDTLSKLIELLQQAKLAESDLMQSALHNLGSAERALGRYPQALEHLQRSVQLQSMRGSNRVNALSTCALGAVMVKLGDFEQAETWIQRGLQRLAEQRAVPVHFQLGCLREQVELRLTQYTATTSPDPGLLNEAGAALAEYQQLAQRFPARSRQQLTGQQLEARLARLR